LFSLQAPELCCAVYDYAKLIIGAGLNVMLFDPCCVAVGTVTAALPAQLMEFQMRGYVRSLCSSGRWLAAGDAAGFVRLLEFGRSFSS
jgi:hypothetical protein